MSICTKEVRNQGSGLPGYYQLAGKKTMAASHLLFHADGCRFLSRQDRPTSHNQYCSYLLGFQK